MMFHNTPGKINGWNLRIHPNLKRKIIFQTIIFRFELLIFGGVFEESPFGCFSYLFEVLPIEDLQIPGFGFWWLRWCGTKNKLLLFFFYAFTRHKGPASFWMVVV